MADIDGDPSAPYGELRRALAALATLAGPDADADRLRLALEALAGEGSTPPAPDQPGPTGGETPPGLREVDDEPGRREPGGRESTYVTPTSGTNPAFSGELATSEVANSPEVSTDPPGATGPGAGETLQDESTPGDGPGGRPAGTVIIPVDAKLACELQHWANHLEVPLSELLRVAMRRHLDHLSGVDGSVPAEPHWEA